MNSATTQPSRRIIALAALAVAAGTVAGCGHTMQFHDYDLIYDEAIEGTRYMVETLSFSAHYALWKDDGRDAVRLSRLLASRWADGRLAAALALAHGGHPDAVEKLRGLLKDSDAAVRRLAADFLFGGNTSLESLARQYDFVNVLEAERRVRRLSADLKRMSGKGQYEATREMILMGRDAVWALHQLTLVKDEDVVRTAVYALQEIRAAPEPPPTWLAERQAKMKRKVSVSFVDWSVSDVIAYFEKELGVDFDLRDEEYPRDGPVNLTVNEMEIGLVLVWVARLMDVDIIHTRKAVVLELQRFACGTTLFWLDVRDLDTSPDRDWGAELNEKALGEDKWIDVPELGTSLDNYDGLLMLMVRSCRLHKRNAGREQMEPVFKYLAGLRGSQQRP